MAVSRISELRLRKMLAREKERGRRAGMLESMMGSPRATRGSAARRLKMGSATVRSILNGKPRTDMAPRAKANRKSPKKLALRQRRSLVCKLATMIRSQKGRKRIPYPSALTIAAAMFKETGVRPSVSTVTRDLHRLGFKNRTRPKRTFNKAKVAKDRHRFAMKKEWRDESFVDAVVWSDETEVDNNDRTCKKQWVKDKKNLVPQTRLSKFNVPNIRIWAAVSVGWRSEIVFLDFGKTEEGRVKCMDAKLYKQHVLTKFVPHLKRRGKVWMQDGARCHTAKLCKTFLEESGVRQLFDWPAHSPDMNMIESLWAVLKRRLSEYPPADSTQELKEQVIKVWRDIPQSTINAHCRHATRRMQEVRAQGPEM